MVVPLGGEIAHAGLLPCRHLHGGGVEGEQLRVLVGPDDAAVGGLGLLIQQPHRGGAARGEHLGLLGEVDAGGHRAGHGDLGGGHGRHALPLTGDGDHHRAWGQGGDLPVLVHLDHRGV